MKYTHTDSLICKEVEQIIMNSLTTITILDGLTFRQRDVIRMIEYYSNSKYLNGQKDELGREKPFHNIINAMCDVENAAKDIDTKNITATADDGQHYTESFLLSKDLYQWMKSINFAKTLNDARDTHTRYGSLLLKKVMKRKGDEELNLHIEIPEWKNVITDQVDIIGSPIIECHYMTPTEMLKKTSWEYVDEALGSMSQGYSHRIPVYEVRGDFPIAFYKQMNGQKHTDDDLKKFSYQLYYLAGEYGQSISGDAQTFQIGKLTPLYWENNTEKVYKYLARKRRSGRAFGVGVPEEGEEAQVWSNDAVLKQARAMEYTTKVIGQSASKKLKGRNMLNEVDDGQILEHEDNRPITALQLLPSGGLNQYPQLLLQWFTQFERATSAYSAQRGESPTSRTSAKLQAAVLQQSGSVMQNLQEDLGILWTEVFEDWVMPYLGKKLNTEHILAHEFSLDELKEIDRNFAVHTANDRAKEEILSGNIVSAEDYANFMQQADEMIKRTKATRFLDLPKNYYKKAKSKITFNITGEQKDKQAAIDSLMGILQIYQANPALINDPVMTQIFMQLIELSGAGVSPVSIIGAIQEKARMDAEATKGQPKDKISQSINFKDLPPDGMVQLAAKAGIKIEPPKPEIPLPGTEEMPESAVVPA